MSLQVAQKFGSFISLSLMCPHQTARFRLGRFRVKSQPADTGKRLSLNRAFSFITVPFANQQSRGRSCSPPKRKDLLSVWATPKPATHDPKSDIEQSRVVPAMASGNGRGGIYVLTEMWLILAVSITREPALYHEGIYGFVYPKYNQQGIL